MKAEASVAALYEYSVNGKTGETSLMNTLFLNS
jgi:hypothetical protein